MQMRCGSMPIRRLTCQLDSVRPRVVRTIKVVEGRASKTLHVWIWFITFCVFLEQQDDAFVDPCSLGWRSGH